MFRRSLAITAGIALLGPLVAGCSGSSSEHKLSNVTMNGEKLSDADKLLTSAERKFTSANQSAIDSKSASVPDDTHCYFRRSKRGSDEVLSKVFCGPIRRAGQDTSHAWDSYGVSGADSEYDDVATSAPGDGAALKITGLDSVNTAVDTALLVRPDGKEPSDPSKVAAPKAPMSSVKNYAAVVDSRSQQTGLSFSKLSRPTVLRTPSATITVSATARPKTVPGWFEALNAPTDETGADGGNVAKVYRPQSGQSLVAYQITVGPGADYPDSNDNSNDHPKDASTALSVQVGGQNLTIHDMSTDGSDDNSWDSNSTDTNSTLTISCSGLPCDSDDSSDESDNETTSYILMMSAPKGSPKLASSVDGETQTLSLADGTVSGSVSDVTASRNNPSQQINTTVPSSKLTVSFDEYDWNDKDLAIGGSIPTVFLTSYDANAGWAPKGKAWLEVPIENRPEDVGDEFSWTWSKTNTLTVGSKTYQADNSAGLDSTATFEVPADFTTGRFRYQPQGTVKGGDDDATKAFKVKKPYEVKINIPER